MGAPEGASSRARNLSHAGDLFLSAPPSQVGIIVAGQRCDGADRLPPLTQGRTLAAPATGCKLPCMKNILPKRAKTANPTEAPPAAPPKFTPRGGSKKRILIAVTDGKIDFQAMSSEASKELNELLHNADVQAQFNIGPLKEQFDPQHCKRIYQALGNVFSGIARLAFKWPNEAAEKLIYTEEEKTELAEPTAKVLDELAPKWLREHQALAALLIVFGSITQNKMREAQAIAIEHLKAKRAASVTPVARGSQPITPPPPAPSPEVMRAELHSDMRRAGIKTTIATAAPAPAPAQSVTLGPTGGPSIPEGANGASA